LAKHQYWAQLWTDGRLGFHKPDVNDSLVKHWQELAGGDSPLAVLVPLCGKTHDLAWLANQRGVSVVGVEFVKQAVDEFVAEHPACKLNVGGAVGKYAHTVTDAQARLSLWCGDIFDLPQDGRFTRVWDRASLVALAPALHGAYVAAISGSLAPGGRILLQTLERATGPEEVRQAGPPYSVSDSDVKALYGALYHINMLDTSDALPSNPRLKDAGLTQLVQRNYLLTKK
jgi:thiopurine S-methyltransferase